MISSAFQQQLTNYISRNVSVTLEFIYLFSLVRLISLSDSLKFKHPSLDFQSRARIMCSIIPYANPSQATPFKIHEVWR